MKLPTLAMALIAAAVIIFAAKSSKHEEASSGVATEQSAAVPVSPVKTLASATCASDGCPVSCESGDTLLSAICVSGSRARFADTLRVDKGVLTATCGTSAGNILVYCGRP